MRRRRPEPRTFSRAQQQAIHSAGDYQQPLTEAEATLLLSVIWCGRSPQYAAFREQHLELERERGPVRRAALVASPLTPGCRAGWSWAPGGEG
ncbi:hypothetical protein [Nonomuraea sp. bgisy101]|uniref:hypothetical protein n=1 Tax=Nonomuraea sp. bgisy101 TaxID=3413784 RepID=UPI003D74B055